MKKSPIKFTLFLIYIALSSCESNIPFNQELWNSNTRDFEITNTRELMLKDLIDSKVLIGITKEKAILMLGMTSKQLEGNKMHFLIREKYSTNIDPDYIKYLVLEINEENKVMNQKIKTTK